MEIWCGALKFGIRNAELCVDLKCVWVFLAVCNRCVCFLFGLLLLYVSWRQEPRFRFIQVPTWMCLNKAFSEPNKWQNDTNKKRGWHFLCGISATVDTDQVYCWDNVICSFVASSVWHGFCCCWWRWWCCSSYYYIVENGAHAEKKGIQSTRET